MGSTGVYWQPVWNLLEDRLQLMLVNPPAHPPRVPGRKTDVTDSQWIAQPLEHGLLSPSFVPPKAQRQLRDLTRQRTRLLGDGARVINRVQKVLETANVKIAGLISDLAGVSGRKVLTALARGKLTPQEMARNWSTGGWSSRSPRCARRWRATWASTTASCSASCWRSSTISTRRSRPSTCGSPR
jgi:hypothetical protein